jgi:hypothetical protein
MVIVHVGDLQSASPLLPHNFLIWTNEHFTHFGLAMSWIYILSRIKHCLSFGPISLACLSFGCKSKVKVIRSQHCKISTPKAWMHVKNIVNGSPLSLTHFPFIKLCCLLSLDLSKLWPTLNTRQTFLVISYLVGPKPKVRITTSPLKGLKKSP